MDNNVKKYLLDISEAIGHIELFTSGLSSLTDYENNLLIKRAVERELEIVGEAMNRLLQLDDAFPISSARRIVDLRNRVIHGYDKVDDNVIWGILKRYLPVLKAEIAQLQNESNTPE